MAETKKPQEEESVTLIRILGRDIPGNKKIYPSLTRLKGVSWSVSNVICKQLKLDKDQKLSELKKDQLMQIEKTLKNFEAPEFLKNRRSDLTTGESKHVSGIDLEMTKDFDIKRLKKIKSYRGMRHSYNLPSRGQRTRSHFRGKGKAVGVKKPKTGKKS